MNKSLTYKKLSKKDGFTLIEMLIVVAIIAILIAISLPMINTALEKARNSTDAANERAAKAAVLLASVSSDKIDGTSNFAAKTAYAYDAKNGKLTLTPIATAADAYGKSVTKAAGTANAAEGGYLEVVLGDNSTVYYKWVPAGTPLSDFTSVAFDPADYVGGDGPYSQLVQGYKTTG